MSTISFKFFDFAGGALLFCVLSGASLAQGPAQPSTVTSVEPSPVVRISAPDGGDHHKFWDRKNQFLFVAVGALNAADFAVTRSNLQSGGKELNPLTRPFSGSTAGLAVNFAGETAGVIGLSYFFHKTGHHKLERIG